MTAYGSGGLRHRPHRQADAALALSGHGFAELLDQRRVIVEQLQVPVDVRAVAEPGDREAPGSADRNAVACGPAVMGARATARMKQRGGMEEAG